MCGSEQTQPASRRTLYRMAMTRAGAAPATTGCHVATDSPMTQMGAAARRAPARDSEHAVQPGGRGVYGYGKQSDVDHSRGRCGPGLDRILGVARLPQEHEAVAWSQGALRTGVRSNRRAARQPVEGRVELVARTRRVESLNILPLEPAEAARFREAWLTMQGRFIDNPAGVLMQADQLVRELMVKRGYPVGDFERRAADISVDHPRVVEHYRAAQAIAARNDRGEADTEELRKAEALPVPVRRTARSAGESGGCLAAAHGLSILNTACRLSSTRRRPATGRRSLRSMWSPAS